MCRTLRARPSVRRCGVNPYAELLDRADSDMPECGTIAAYTAHRRRGEQPCGQCRTAANAYAREHTAAEPTRGRSADAARRIALDDHRRQRAELQATIAAEGIQL